MAQASSRWPARIERAAARVEDALLVLLLGAMVLLAAWQIVLRNLFAAGMQHSDSLLRVMVLWVGLLGAMAATRADRHIRIDILSRLLAGRAKRLAGAVSALFTAVVCAFVSYHGARLVVLEYETGSVAFAAVPAWATELIIPIGFGVIALRYLALFLRRSGGGETP